MESNNYIAIASITVATVSLIVSLIMLCSMWNSRRISSKNKEINFLYKRLREFKTFLNEYSESIRRKPGSKRFQYQDITICQIFLSDTILTSKILDTKFSDKKDWENIKYNKKIANSAIDKLNLFANNLWEIANSRTEWTDNSLGKKFILLVNKFVYIEFYDILNEIL